ncbi:MAG: hypothetical protein Q8K78_00160, partial [Planctomycetaceae bacterium]|nr:hypothetical protein [Planctomycetaceae bacterium]
MRFPVSPSVLMAVFGCLLAISGCGLQNYEKRLEETKKYYAYLEKIDTNLAPAWKEGPIEELRVPMQFRPIRKPAPVKNAEGETEDNPVDPRQPNYISLELPGLLGAWEAPFDIVVDGKKQPRKGYIYVVSNYSMFNTELASQAPDFMRTLLGTISDRLSLPPVDLAKGEREQYPKIKADAYTAQNTYDVYRFKSDELLVDGVPYTIDAYTTLQKELQVDVLVVMPVGIDSQAKMIERVALMLERLKIDSKKKPARAGKAAGGAATPTSAA